MDESLVCFTLAEAEAAIRSKRISPLELTEAYLDRTAAIDSSLNSFLEVAAESALRDARRATEAITTRQAIGPLHGIPMALKDLFDVSGMRTTAGSAFLKENRPTQDAFIVQKLRQAGAVFLGKLNMHEWALGVTNVNPHFGACVNPWTGGSTGLPQSIPGGSSGGSAAALAGRLCLGSVGSDTGGSTRIPASLCGVVGFKPTRGRVSMRGAIPLSWSLDHAGPMARTVEDAAILLDVIAGYDGEDPASVNHPVENFQQAVQLDSFSTERKIGIPGVSLLEDLDPEVESAFRIAVQRFSELGGAVEEISLDGADEAMEASSRMLLADAATFHQERLQNHPKLFGEDVRARLSQGLKTTGMEYALARRTQQEWKRKIARLFETVDLLMMPATPIPAPPIEAIDGMKMAGSVLTRFMRLFNLTGVPALVLPCGFTSRGLPIGLEIVGPAWSEGEVLRAARAYEMSTEWHRRFPHLG